MLFRKYDMAKKNIAQSHISPYPVMDLDLDISNRHDIVLTEKIAQKLCWLITCLNISCYGFGFYYRLQLMNCCWEFEPIYISNFYYLSRYPVMDLDLDFENSIMFIELSDMAKILLEVKCPHVWLLIQDFYHEISMI